MLFDSKYIGSPFCFSKYTGYNAHAQDSCTCTRFLCMHKRSLVYTQEIFVCIHKNLGPAKAWKGLAKALQRLSTCLRRPCKGFAKALQRPAKALQRLCKGLQRSYKPIDTSSFEKSCHGKMPKTPGTKSVRIISFHLRDRQQCPSHESY